MFIMELPIIFVLKIVSICSNSTKRKNLNPKIEMVSMNGN